MSGVLLSGKVVSTAMSKTVVIEVQSFRVHPLYKKTIYYSKRYKAHDDLGVKKGESVTIQQTRPFSREVFWKVIERVKA